MVLLLAAIFAYAQTSPCHFDRAAMLALDQRAFDQDETTGWRGLLAKDCKAEAADLIRDYRSAKRSPDPTLLYWHEGQLRAELGQVEVAIELFGRSRRSPAMDRAGWNHYVDGSIAFLRGDRDGLLAARSRLATLPRPDAELRMKVGNRLVEIAWPPNLNVLDGFVRCFDKSYEQAYACASPIWRNKPAPASN